jgi:phosphopantothenoylcysteine decarboxylase/phosphopantothenate--cysteine ligase
LHSDLVGNSKLNGVRVLVTAGPTQEAIDPVRYIGNRSSGKMGFALAEEAALRGATVHLITGPTHLRTTSPGIERTDVVSAADMATACKRIAPDREVVIMSAAVADFRPAGPAAEKIKKQQAVMEMVLEPTEDILAWMGANKPEGQVLVGFALETTHGEDHARGKLQRKNLDLIILNSLQDAGAGFGHDTNKVTLIGRDTKRVALPLMSKIDTARAILDHIEELL